MPKKQTTMHLTEPAREKLQAFADKVRQTNSEAMTTLLMAMTVEEMVSVFIKYLSNEVKEE